MNTLRFQAFIEFFVAGGEKSWMRAWERGQWLLCGNMYCATISLSGIAELFRLSKRIHCSLRSSNTSECHREPTHECTIFSEDNFRHFCCYGNNYSLHPLFTMKQEGLFSKFEANVM